MRHTAGHRAFAKRGIVWREDARQVARSAPATETRDASSEAREPADLYSLAMSLSLRFLGTSASSPTVERNVASLALVREGETLLFD